VAYGRWFKCFLSAKAVAHHKRRSTTKTVADPAGLAVLSAASTLEVSKKRHGN
jgi:hypothetical protein